MRVSYLCCPIYSIIPESPRWLLSKGKREEAMAIIEKLSRWNRKPLTKEMILSLESGGEATKGRFWQLFTTRSLAFRTLVIFINWYVCVS